MSSPDTLPSPRSRPSPVQSLRLTTPYVAFAPRVITSWSCASSKSPRSTSHAHPKPPISTFSSKPWNSGYGSRHYADKAPFCLWDDDLQDFKYPTIEESGWISRTFSAVAVQFSPPRIFIETATPPSPIPLTVGCVAARFIAPGSDYPTIYTNTAYSNPRVADPVPTQFRWPQWERPTKEQCRVVWEHLAQTMNIEAVNFLSPIIVVELHADDGRKYGKRSLPGRVAGRLTLYHHGTPSFWDSVPQAKERPIQPSAAVQDTTNYLKSNLRSMCPGVRVESSPISRQGTYPNTTMASSAGVLIRSVDQGQRLTVSNHGFLDTDEVYHPSQSGGDCIGLITERFEHLDIALVDLFPASTFTNNEYFEAHEPQRLLRSSEIRENMWCNLDGLASGLAFLRTEGVRVLEAQRPSGVKIPHTRFLAENIYECIGLPGGQICEGVCGAPIVVDDEQAGHMGGGVVGFFHLGAPGSRWALAPCLDDLIDRGWGLV